MERTYGFKGLDLAYQAYEIVYGVKPEADELMRFLKNDISAAAGSSVVNQITGKSNLSEITAEILGYNKKENEFVDEFKSLIRKERIRWLKSSTHHG